MSTIPPPPVLGPLTLAPSNAAPVGQCAVEVYFWEILGGKWTSFQDTKAWDDLPAGYYATSWYDGDGPLVPNAWGEHSTAIVVTARTKPDGTAAPYVLENPTAGEASPLCPPAMYIPFPTLYNPFGYHQPLCALTAGAEETTLQCPEGTAWDPVTETCKAITLPIFPILPPPGLPPPFGPLPPPGQPENDGDEITLTLCAQIQGAAATIVAAIQQLQQQQGQEPEPVSQCCAEVVAAIGLVANNLTTIATLLGQLPTPAEPPSDPVTCAQLTDLFRQLIAAINGTEVLTNPTPPVAPEPFTPTPYTALDALADVEALKNSMPFVAPVTQS